MGMDCLGGKDCVNVTSKNAEFFRHTRSQNRSHCRLSQGLPCSISTCSRGIQSPQSSKEPLFDLGRPLVGRGLQQLTQSSGLAGEALSSRPVCDSTPVIRPPPLLQNALRFVSGQPCTVASPDVPAPLSPP